MDSDIVKPAKFGHSHLVYLFITPLNFYMSEWKKESLSSITLNISASQTSSI